MSKASKQIIKSIQHKWMSLFFFGAAGLSFFQLRDTSTLLKISLVSGSCLAVGLYFLARKSQDCIWIEGKNLFFSMQRGKEVKTHKLAINKIKAVRLEFTGSRQVKVYDRCYLETSDKEEIELPSGIHYSPYNPRYAGMSFLMKPLRNIKPDIQLIIDDKVERNRLDFSHLK